MVQIVEYLEPEARYYIIINIKGHNQSDFNFKGQGV